MAATEYNKNYPLNPFLPKSFSKVEYVFLFSSIFDISGNDLPKKKKKATMNHSGLLD